MSQTCESTCEAGFYGETTTLTCLESKHPHQNVLSMKEFFQDQQHTIIVFPFISGGKLYQKKEYKNIKKTLKQALKGLQHIHQLGLIHRDIKMDNIMIDENETIKIIDFGFAINKNETNLIEERSPQKV